MFTGIIEKTSKVASTTKRGGGLLVSVFRPPAFTVKKGESVSVNGVCSTVIALGKNMQFFYMPETLNKTYFSGLKKGQKVNLEHSLKLSERLSGHMVLGHVDAAA